MLAPVFSYTSVQFIY